jgi:hypothetical protein
VLIYIIIPRNNSLIRVIRCTLSVPRDKQFAYPRNSLYSLCTQRQTIRLSAQFAVLRDKQFAYPRNSLYSETTNSLIRAIRCTLSVPRNNQFGHGSIQGNTQCVEVGVQTFMFGHPYAILRTPTRYPFIAIFEPCPNSLIRVIRCTLPTALRDKQFAYPRHSLYSETNNSLIRAILRCTKKPQPTTQPNAPPAKPHPKPNDSNTQY